MNGIAKIYGSNGLVFEGTCVLSESWKEMVAGHIQEIADAAVRTLELGLIHGHRHIELGHSRPMRILVSDEVWGDHFALAPSIITTPRTDAAARRRLPTAPGVQLYYVGLRAWGKSIEESFVQAWAFARCLY